MEIVEKSYDFEIKNLSWDEAYLIQISLKKISELIGTAKYDGEYHKQEAMRMKSKIDGIIGTFITSLPRGKADGIVDNILKFI